MATDKTKQERLERDEYSQDKGELDQDTLRQRLKHHQDAIKNLIKEINSLEKDKKEDEQDVKDESKAELTKDQKKLPPALQKAILKKSMMRNLINLKRQSQLKLSSRKMEKY